MKLHYILLGLAALLTSCSSDFLDLYPKTGLNESNFYRSDDEFVLLVNSSYIPLRNLGKTVNWDINEVKSDNMGLQDLNTNIEQSRNDGFVLSSASTVHASHWNNSYAGIYNCNTAITALETVAHTWANPALKERSLGEVYFLRALYYFDLVRHFGGVPLVTKEVSGEEAVGIKRATVDATYEQIVSDLKTAIGHLSGAIDVDQPGRVNLGAAQALLGKVYLTRKAYAMAEEQLYAVIRSGRFGLLQDYADVFDPTNKDYFETLFAIQYSETAADLCNTFIFFNAPTTSKGEVTGRPNVALPVSIAIKPTADLLAAFEEGDKRYDVSIGTWTGPDMNGEEKEFFYCAKYKGPQTATLGWCGDNFPILRYSDVLLMYAEVLNELGRTEEAIPFVREVRHRAGLMNDLTALGKAELTALIERERQVEFCFENQRWFDLLRTDRALEVLQAQKKNIQPFHLLAPIPGEQVLINQIEQNPGY
jgi:SusD family.